MNYSKTLKPNLVDARQKIKECTQRVNGHATNDVMTQKEVKCTPNNQCKCTLSNEEQGMLLREVQNFSSNEYAIILYENLTNILQANLMQVPC